MLRRLGRIAVTAGALVLPACSDDLVSEPPGAGATAAGMAGNASGAGGAANSAGNGGGSGSAGSAGSTPLGASGAPAMACSSYADGATWSLVVHIKNEMTQTLYLGQDTMSCEIERLFQVADGARTLLPALAGCRSSCEAMMTTGRVSCPTVCATPATVTLEPGQSIDVPWDGRFGVDFALPQQCATGAPSSTLQCVQAKRIEANIYTFSARAGTRRQCLEPAGNCTCTPSAIGGCTSPSSLIAGTIFTTELLLKLEPGEPATNGEPPYIGLVFQPQ
jgi:hypothetical protein